MNDRRKSIEAYMNQLEHKSYDTYQHCLRVSRLARGFAAYLQLSPSEQAKLVQGCYLHDLGKLFIPDAILKHEGALTTEQWSIMRAHSMFGGMILDQLFTSIDSSIYEVVVHHHEHWDGSGYPSNQNGEQIPYFARICSIIDAFDSMISDRCYRKGLSYEQCISELRKHSGKQFDPKLVEKFIEFTNSAGYPLLPSTPAYVSVL